MLDYLVKVLLFQTLFLVIYDLVLKKETFFQWNRGYLLITSLMAYVIPLIKIRKVEEVIPQEYVILLPEVVLSPQTVIKQQFDWSAFLFTSMKWIFMLGVIVAFALFLVKLFKVVGLIYTNEIERKKGYIVVYIDSKSPFSFFSYIFLNKDLTEQIKSQILDHELVHVRQKHSLDLIFFEVQRIVFWFNPFSYIYQRRVAELHEYIADSKSIKAANKEDYFQNLLGAAFGTQKISFINPFFKHSLIKKRIIMLNKKRSEQFLKCKYVLVLPLLLSMLVYNSYGQNKSIEPNHENEKKEMVIYTKTSDGFIVGNQTGVDSYFDVYEKDAKPISADVISYFELSDKEKEDFARFRKPPLTSEEEKAIEEYKIITLINGRKALWERIGRK